MSPCTFPGVQKLITTDYHPKQNEKVVRYKGTLVSQSCLYIVEHKRDKDVYPQSLTYPYSFWVYRSKAELPIALRLTRHPPEIRTLDEPTAFATYSGRKTAGRAMSL